MDVYEKPTGRSAWLLGLATLRELLQISLDVGLTALELWRQCFSEVFDKRLDPSDVPIEFSIVNVDIAYEDIMRKSRHKRSHSNITWCDLHW
jgi:hypothetical protein